MPRVTASQGADKYRQGVQGGATRYQQGIANVKTAPSQKAIEQKDKMVQNWLASVNSGKWEQEMGKVSLSMWQEASRTKGATNYSSSADKASQAYAAWASEAYPIIQQIQDQIASMPSTTIDQNIQRMITNVTLMAERLG